MEVALHLNRREFIQVSGSAGAALFAGSCRLGQEHVWACQLYTVRDLLPNSAEATLRTVAEIGYRGVEVSGPDLIKLSPYLEQFSLRPIACHFSVAVLEEGNGQAEIEMARERGIEYSVIPVLPPQLRGGLDDYRKFAEKMNLFGERCQSAGLMLAYHNHAFEFEPMEGSSPIEVMMNSFEPGLVGLELDVFWSSVAGVDPVQMLNRYPGQIPLVHLKDKAEGTKQTYDGNDVRADQFKEVGSGVLDMPAIIEAADAQGAQHFIVEQDQCPGNPLESLRASFEYLQKAVT